MEKVVGEILDALRTGDAGPEEIDRIIRARSAQAHDGRRVFAKKNVLPFYLHERQAESALWKSWDVDASLDARFVKALQMKPRRTASGVATITVLTKPWPCANDCVYCPNDARMPKSYLADEPACQRAERNRFHPYLQVASRLRALGQMGHDTGKVELIVLGGTWTDYPARYREWFVAELFRACNDDAGARDDALERADSTGELPSAENSAFDLADLHAANERAAHRVVGLVVETRPDSVTCGSLAHMRMLGCTKVQLGVQSVDDDLLRLNGRRETAADIARALELVRLFGFKTHAHFMLNLLGATPEGDVRDYGRFMDDPAFRPDEVKLYPCALVAGTQLQRLYERGEWKPYTEDELVGALCACMRATPGYTRVSRVIRDISSKDILAGNKKTNLRQMVDGRLRAEGADVREIRFREIGTGEVDLHTLGLSAIPYATGATDERFLQWTTPQGKIAGFLRLSLPHAHAFARHTGLPTAPGEAMIREVHVYGFATRAGAQGASAQHHGLGRALVERACDMARDAGYKAVHVISAVGTREYYRSLGFADNGTYQTREL